MIKFRQKEFNKQILSKTIQGAGIGAAVGTLSASIIPATGLAKNKFFKNKSTQGLMALGAGTVIGAALGALAGIVTEGEKFLRKGDVGKNDLLKNILSMLSNAGFKRDVEFTDDPKLASLLKIRVCIVITKVSGDLKLVINCVSDKKLKEIANKASSVVIKRSNLTEIRKTETDRYNDLVISTVSKGAKDANLIANIAKLFIAEGYPVYFVEAG